MAYLDTSQTKAVAEYLASFKQLTTTAREELLDHLCSAIEDEMATGKAFEQAFAVCRERWNENEVRHIISSNQNRFTMLKLVLGGLLVAVFATSPFISPDQKTEPSVSTILLVETTAAEAEPPSICPLSSAYRLTSGYGPRRHPLTQQNRLHQGVDWAAPQGTPIMAAGSGTVLEAGNLPNYGNYILIGHDETYQTFYAHLYALDVQAGDVVTQGQQIGQVGNTGSSLGPHLHYEVFKNGQRVNPADYLP